jgi:DNA-binding NtrC family response regulator/tetratricopeptide (TPR) repeat protein
MIASRQGSLSGVERFPLPSSRDRWLEFSGLEHATLPLPVGFDREGDDLVVRRAAIDGRKISAGRIDREQAPLLFLQAAGLCAFLQSFGFWLAEEDLTEAVHERSKDGPRLWLTRTPLSVSLGGPGPSPAAVLAAFLHRLFGRGRRVWHPAARALFDSMLAGDAPLRRAEFWLASTYRAFPEVAGPAAADARTRTIGVAGSFLRDVTSRALMTRARAVARGREPRVFCAGDSALTAGAALGLPEVPLGAAAAARALRVSHERRDSSRRSLWIAVEPDRWDSISRHAFETARRALGEEIEVVTLDGQVPTPVLPDEWRREIFVPCGTLSASLRFYDAFSQMVRAEPASARSVAQRLTASPDWARFVADPTGDAPLPLTAAEQPEVPLAGVRRPPGLERELLDSLAAYGGAASADRLSRLFPGRSLSPSLERLRSRGAVTRDGSGRWSVSPSGRREALSTPVRHRLLCRRWASSETEVGKKVELLIDAGDFEEACTRAKRWQSESGANPPDRWFALSARLTAATEGRCPAWLGLLEAEREVAGGRLPEARVRLLEVAEAGSSSPEEKAAARLRAAEVLSRRGHSGQAAGEAAAWRSDFPDAPARDKVRALRLEASARAREGEQGKALTLLDEAERQGASGPLADRLETELVRADVYWRAGRRREEAEIYDRWRAAVAHDERLSARLLAHEALSLSDRRDFAGSIARLEQALAVCRDDAAERANLLLDLATELFHAGRVAACAPVLEEALALASSAGRDDLALTAQANLAEMAVDQTEWDQAARGIEAILRAAQEEGDQLRRLIGLHHRSRLALRKGLLEEAERDNAEARELAIGLKDWLEVGELWLEHGDRALLAGDLDLARRAWQTAVETPPNRFDTAARARERLRDLAARGKEGPEAPAIAEVEKGLAGGDYSAAERVARWHVLFDSSDDSPELYLRAQELLRARGGAALADRVFGPGDSQAGQVPPGLLRSLRESLAAAMGGEETPPLPSSLGITGLSVCDTEGREVLRVGTDRPARSVAPWSRSLAAGTARYDLALWPTPPSDCAEAIALLVETLLYRRASPSPPAQFAEGWQRFQVVTGDASMEEPYRRLVRFASQPVTVLVLGESGSGKEAVARAVHDLSPRRRASFVAVNVPAIPPALLESELFGHVRGAFTGADQDRRGLLEEAQGGTIFFDEIGDLPLALQSKLLRALQEREIRRVGENRSRAIDVRVVSATSRTLSEAVERGVFREDLYYRLHVAVITLPPLRDRGRDVHLLARHFLSRFAKEYGRGHLQLAPETAAALSSHSWPGNVRELQNVIAQAAALAEVDAVVAPDLLPEPLRRERRAAAPEGYRSRVDAHRRGLILEALERTGGNRTRAARDLGLSRQALLYLIRELNVPARPRTSH